MKTETRSIFSNAKNPEEQLQVLNDYSDFQVFFDSLGGVRGHDQKRIAETGLKLVTTLLQKNGDYGSSAWKSPMLAPALNPSDAILVRISDKIERIKSLQLKAVDSELPEIVSESLDDTIMDLAGYAMLWLAKPRNK